MHRFRLRGRLVSAFLLAAAGQIALAQTATQPSGLTTFVEEVRQRARRALTDDRLFDFQKLRDDVDEVTAGLLAAAERIRVHPAAAEAGVAFSFSDFGGAVRKCEEALRADPRDPYAHYLAGLARIELGDFAAAATDFDAVVRVEPGSRSSAVLADFCLRVKKVKPPVDDEAIVLHFEAVLAKIAPKWAEPEDDEAASEGPTTRETLTRMVADLFAFPELLRDPLLYKIEAEAFEERGPLGYPLTRMVAAATKAGDPLFLYGKLEFALCPSVLTEGVADEDDERDGADDSDSCLTEAQRTEKQAHDFLREYAELQNNALTDELREQLSVLRRKQPDEGLWMLCEIARDHGETVGDDIVYKPLTPDELATLERVGSAPLFTMPGLMRYQRNRQTLTNDRYPLQTDLADTPNPILAGTRNILVHRVGTTVKEAAARGDSATVRRLIDAANRVCVRLRAAQRSAELPPLIVELVFVAIESESAWNALKYTQLEPLAWLDAHRVIRCSESVTTLARAAAATGIGPLKLPSPRIVRAFETLYRTPAPDWVLRRAIQQANVEGASDDASIIERSVTWKPGSNIRYIYRPAILKLKSVLPTLRRVRTAALDDHRLCAMIWAFGELGDATDRAWLEGFLADPRPWVPIAAREALQRLQANPASQPGR